MEPDAFHSYRRTCWGAALAALVAGVAEYSYGRISGSEYLLSDAVGWAYSFAIYSLSAVSYRSSWQRKAEFALAGIFLVQGAQSAYEVAKSFLLPSSTGAREVAIGSIGAFAVALVVAALFFRYRRTDDAEQQATWLAARNDTLSSFLDVIVLILSKSVISAEWPQNVSDAVSSMLILWAGVRVAAGAIREGR